LLANHSEVVGGAVSGGRLLRFRQNQVNHFFAFFRFFFFAASDPVRGF
jgi:hypothetical protein